jgi:hypothetical protein
MTAELVDAWAGVPRVPRPAKPAPGVRKVHAWWCTSSPILSPAGPCQCSVPPWERELRELCALAVAAEAEALAET